MSVHRTKLPSPPEPFVYIAGRPYLPLTPAHMHFPVSLTEEKGDALLQHLGKEVSISFRECPPTWEGGSIFRSSASYQPYAAASALVESAAKIPYRQEELRHIDHNEEVLSNLFDTNSTKTHEPNSVFDWYYQFQFRVSDSSFMKKIMSRHDRRLPHSQEAYSQLLHQRGGANWGGLEIELPLSQIDIFRTDIDLFAPPHSHTPTVVIVSLHSHNPEALLKYRNRTV